MILNAINTTEISTSVHYGKILKLCVKPQATADHQFTEFVIMSHLFYESHLSFCVEKEPKSTTVVCGIVRGTHLSMYHNKM